MLLFPYFSKFYARLTQALKVILAGALLSIFVYAPPVRAALTESDGGIPATNQILPALYIQNLLLKALLGSYGKPDTEKVAILRAAEAKMIRFISQPRYLQQIQSQDDLDRVKDLYFPNYYNIEDELATSAKTDAPPYLILAATSPQGQDAIDAEIAEAGARYLSISKIASLLPRSIHYPLLNSFYKLLEHGKNVKYVLDAIPDSGRLELAKWVENFISNKLKMIDSIGTKMADSDSFKFQSETQQRFFQIALTEYFKGLDNESKMNMIANFLDHLSLKTNRERFELMLLDAGPQFQKLLQASARKKGLNAEFKAMLRRLEQGTKAAPWRLIAPSIAELNPKDFKFGKMKEKAVAAGSMAQVHKGEIIFPDGRTKTVAIRVLKPGIESFVRRDTSAFAHVADVIDSDPYLVGKHFPKFTPHVKELEMMTSRELSVSTMVASNIKGKKIYERKLKLDSSTAYIRVPDMQSFGENSRVSIQDWVEGVSFEDYMKENPDEARQVVEQLAKMWLTEALFGSGFYHADLHHGNLRVSKDDGKTVLNILDFGMAGQIDKKLQNQFLAFGALIDSRNADVMAKIIWEISEKSENTITFDKLKELIQAELDNQDASGKRGPFHEWIDLSLNAGISFPSELAFLGRGAFYVFNMLEEQESSTTMPKLIKEIFIRHPLKALEVINSTPTISKSEWMHALYDQAQNFRAQSKARAAQQTAQPAQAGYCSDAFAN